MEFGISDPRALFPCPSGINTVPDLVSRGAARKIRDLLLAGEQYTCLHGAAGVGKTTALQEIGASLPQGSILISFDCYGAGTYLDPSEYRHRPWDALIHLSNDIAQHLRLPFLLGREETTDYTRAFKRRLIIAAQTLAASRPDALLRTLEAKGIMEATETTAMLDGVLDELDSLQKNGAMSPEVNAAARKAIGVLYLPIRK